jgi:hypothetical protein
MRTEPHLKTNALPDLENAAASVEHGRADDVWGEWRLPSHPVEVELDMPTTRFPAKPPASGTAWSCEELAALGKLQTCSPQRSSYGVLRRGIEASQLRQAGVKVALPMAATR